MPTEPEVIEAEAEDVTDNLPAVRQHEAVVARSEITVDELLGQRTKITDVMQRAMVKDTHYGIIPGTTKPTLLKPGAELLNVLLRLAPSYQRERTWHDDGHLTVESNCTLTHIPTGLVISAGGGLCSTKESKYAYRNAERLCPECGEPQVRKGKARGNQPGNWYCWKKMDGCGATWPLDGEQARLFEAMEVGKVANPDLADSYNTVVKMADKRALIAAVLNGTAASDVFTQDVEDAAPAPAGGEPGAAPTAAVENRPGTVLPTSFPAGKDLLERIGEALKHANPDVDWLACWDQAIRYVYIKPRAELADGEMREAITRLANVADRLTEGGDFPPTDSQPVAAAFAQFFQGVVIDVAYHEPAEAVVAAGVEPDDSIPFGE